MQVEVAFMQWFSQMAIWTQLGNTGPQAAQEASEGMQARSAETMELLQRYTESPPKGKD